MNDDLLERTKEFVRTLQEARPNKELEKEIIGNFIASLTPEEEKIVREGAHRALAVKELEKTLN